MRWSRVRGMRRVDGWDGWDRRRSETRHSDLGGPRTGGRRARAVEKYETRSHCADPEEPTVTCRATLSLPVKQKGLRGLVVPDSNAAEAAVVENLKVIPVASLAEVAAFFARHLEIAFTPSRLQELFQSHGSVWSKSHAT